MISNQGRELYSGDFIKKKEKKKFKIGCIQMHNLFLSTWYRDKRQHFDTSVKNCDLQSRSHDYETAGICTFFL